MQSTLSASQDARRQRQPWPLGTIRESTRFDVVDTSGETLAERLPLSEARDFRDRWNACRPDRQAAVIYKALFWDTIAGDRIEFPDQETSYKPAAAMKASILYEDNDFMIVNKPGK